MRVLQLWVELGCKLFGHKPWKAWKKVCSRCGKDLK